MSEPPTLRQIAERAGLSTAAVSQALRGSHRISESTRKRVKALADEMGWRPNPLVSAHQARLRALHPPKYQATMAWIDDHEKEVWTGRRLLQGAVNRAQELGFRVDVVRMGEVDAAHYQNFVPRLRRVLRSRGITGMIMPELRVPTLATEDWSGFCVVALGKYSGSLLKARVARRREVVFHEVSADSYHNVWLALDRLRGFGCERIGLALTEWHDYVEDYMPSAQFHVYQERIEPRRRIPIFRMFELPRQASPEFARWVETYRPDAILCVNDEVRDWVAQLGMDVPAKIKLAHAGIVFTESGWSGVDICEDRLGATAVEILSAQLLHNDSGPPPYVKRLLVPGVWRDGQTT
jgi:DNA-binding LacI/PurR family transcriptional regulator